VNFLAVSRGVRRRRFRGSASPWLRGRAAWPDLGHSAATTVGVAGAGTCGTAAAFPWCGPPEWYRRNDGYSPGAGRTATGNRIGPAAGPDV